MFGTETDQASYQAALKNVEINSLQSLVKGKYFFENRDSGS